MLQRVLQCVAVCLGLGKLARMCIHTGTADVTLQRTATHCITLQRSMLHATHCNIACCSVLQIIAVRHSDTCAVPVCTHIRAKLQMSKHMCPSKPGAAVCCSVLQCVLRNLVRVCIHTKQCGRADLCLQHTTTRYYTLQRSVLQCVAVCHS